jgi:hypothetical protein
LSISYAGQAPPAPRRPAAVQLAAALLVLMAVVGLGYGIATLAVAPGVVDRFRAAAGADRTDVDGYVTVVWTGAALGAVLGVIIFALFLVLALALRRGSNTARIGTWVFCGLGVLFGCGTAVAVAAQRAGEGTPGTLGYALSEAYPGGWIGLNLALAVAQMAGYLVVAILLIASPREFFRGSATQPPGPTGPYVTLPTYGSAQSTGTSQPPTAPPTPGPDDDYWARPSS